MLFVIKRDNGQFWSELQSNWTVRQVATEYDSEDDCPTFLEWKGMDGPESLELDGDSYFDDQDAIAWIERTD